MTPAEEADIRARSKADLKFERSSQAAIDRRILLAEFDRLRGLLVAPSDAMIEAALVAWFGYGGGYVYSKEMKAEMRAGLVAAGKEAMKP